MVNLEDELAQDYLAESREQLIQVEADLIAIQRDHATDGPVRIGRIFQALHSIQGGAQIFGLSKIGELARSAESVLAPIRDGSVAAGPEHLQVLLRAVDMLRNLVQTPEGSNAADISELARALERVGAGERPTAVASKEKKLRLLLVEDDLASRLLLQTFLSRYGDCHAAVNGAEAVAAVRLGLEKGERYDLICMDIMMPEMNGREAVREIRALEDHHGILSSSGAKIIMTTAIDDIKEVVRCFHELCDSYLIKPVELATLLERMRGFNLIP